MIKPRQDWGEHVYQGMVDDVIPYETTSAVYNLVDVLKQINYKGDMDLQGENLMDVLRPHLIRLMDIVGEDMDKYLKGYQKYGHDTEE